MMLNISWKGSYSGCLVINSAFLALQSSPLCFSYKRKHHFSNKWFRRSMLSVFSILSMKDHRPRLAFWNRRLQFPLYTEEDTHVISETSMYYSCNLWRKQEKVVINLA